MSGNTLEKSLLNRVSLYYEDMFWSDEFSFAKDYMLSRGFTEETLKKFGVGYAPPQMRVELSDEDDILLRNIEHIREFKADRFRDRVVFPVRDASGDVCGFSGRAIPPSDRVKYMNSAESSSYKKTDLLFGLYQARERIFKTNKAIICEGYTDVMAFYQANIPVAVASMGTSLTKRHLYQLARYTKNLYFAFDGDDGGSKAHALAFSRATELGFNVGNINIPEGLDPAEFLLKPLENTILK